MHIYRPRICLQSECRETICCDLDRSFSYDINSVDPYRRNAMRITLIIPTNMVNSTLFLLQANQCENLYRLQCKYAVPWRMGSFSKYRSKRWFAICSFSIPYRLSKWIISTLCCVYSAVWNSNLRVHYMHTRRVVNALESLSNRALLNTIPPPIHEFKVDCGLWTIIRVGCTFVDLHYIVVGQPVWKGTLWMSYN